MGIADSIIPNVSSTPGEVFWHIPFAMYYVKYSGLTPFVPQQLIVLANLESLNAEFIRHGIPQKERLLRLNASAQQMMKSLLQSVGMKKLNALNMPKPPEEDKN